jgi:hypothetical protein
VPFLKCEPTPAIISHVPLVIFVILEALKFKESELVLTPLGHEYDKGPAICLAVVSLTSIKAFTCSNPSNKYAIPIMARAPRHFNKIELMLTIRTIISSAYI